MSKISLLRRKLKEIQSQLESELKGIDHSRTRKDTEKDILSSKLKDYRSMNGLTQKELADELGVGILSIIRWEGKASLPCGAAKKQLVKLGIIKE